jgi:hypothetical protein
MKSAVIVIVALGALLFSSCTRSIASFGSVSLDPIPEKKCARLIENGAVGEDKVAIVWFIPLGTASIEKAIRDALNKYNGDYLSNVEIRETFFHTYFFGSYGYRVTGTIWKWTDCGSDSSVTDTAATFRIIRKNGKDTLVKER